jgi:hypothetical protein
MVISVCTLPFILIFHGLKLEDQPWTCSNSQPCTHDTFNSVFGCGSEVYTMCIGAEGLGAEPGSGRLYWYLRLLTISGPSSTLVNGKAFGQPTSTAQSMSANEKWGNVDHHVTITFYNPHVRTSHANSSTTTYLLDLPIEYSEDQ